MGGAPTPSQLSPRSASLKETCRASGSAGACTNRYRVGRSPRLRGLARKTEILRPRRPMARPATMEGRAGRAAKRYLPGRAGTRDGSAHIKVATDAVAWVGV